MTIKKSLKYEPEKLGHGHIHRTHVSKKNRKPFKNLMPGSIKYLKFLREKGKITKYDKE